MISSCTSPLHICVDYVGSVRMVKGDMMLITIVSEIIASKTAAEWEAIAQEYDDNMAAFKNQGIIM